MDRKPEDLIDKTEHSYSVKAEDHPGNLLSAKLEGGIWKCKLASGEWAAYDPQPSYFGIFAPIGEEG